MAPAIRLQNGRLHRVTGRIALEGAVRMLRCAMRYFETVRLFVEFVAELRISETASHGPINSDRPGNSNIVPTFFDRQKTNPNLVEVRT